MSTKQTKPITYSSTGVNYDAMDPFKRLAQLRARATSKNLNRFGESLLVPTHIYAGLIRDYFEAGIDIHYVVNITGHGWRKIMRANRDLSYIIDRIPPAQPVFQFIQEHSGNDDQEMYENFNMGAGFAIFMPDQDVELAQKIAMEKYRWQSVKAGYVDQGPRQVIIQPKNLTFQGEALRVR